MRRLRSWIGPGRWLASASLVVLALVASGCGEEEDPRPARWSYIYPTLIQPACNTSGCHAKHTATFGFQLDTPEGAYIDLVGGMFSGPNQPFPPQSYVKPGRPDESRLLYLLRGDNVAYRMPPDGPLPEADIALIEKWILAGAKND